MSEEQIKALAAGTEILPTTSEEDASLVFSGDEKKVLQEQRLAILNILEDVNEAQVKLKHKLQESDLIRRLNEQLGNTLRPNVIVDYIVDTIKEFMPDRQLAWLFIKSGNFQQDHCVEFDLREELGFDYCDLIVKKLKEEIMENKALAEDGYVFSDKNQFYFLENYKNYKKANKKKPMVSDTFFMTVTKTFSLVINISSADDYPIMEQDKTTIDYILESATQTIYRLKSLVSTEQVRFGDLLESVDSGVILFDTSLNIIAANRFIRNIVDEVKDKISLADLSNKIFYSKDPGQEEMQTLGQAIGLVLEKGEEIRIKAASYKNSYFDIFVGPTKDFQKNLSGGIVVLYDITYLKELDKLKTDFVSIASHQLRTPLTGIKLLLENLADPEVGPLNDLQKEYISDLNASSVRMIKLVNDLLNVSRIEAGRLKIESRLTNMVALVELAVKEARVLFGSDCEIEFQKIGEFSDITLDAQLFSQVVNNLIFNAQRYSLEKHNKITVTLEKQTDGYLLSVKDQGIGIEDKDKSKIFQKFYRADSAIKKASDGSGLGLYVAKMVIEISGGQIWFESAGKNQGATFYVKLPLTGMRNKQGEVGLIG